jgi:hypothetical protein
MFKQSATDEKQSPEQPLMHPGVLPDSEPAEQPPVPESPYKPYSDKPAQSDPAYRPYSEKPAQSERAYRPYSEKPALDEASYEPYKSI